MLFRTAKANLPDVMDRLAFGVSINMLEKIL